MTMQDNSAASIAQSSIPWPTDDNKARYLGYRASGFTIREALHLVDCAHSTLSLWRKDPEFVSVEERLPTLAANLRTQFIGMDFVRNFRLVLKKDFEVLKKSLGMVEEPNKDGKFVTARLTAMENAYLTKMRSMYTPEALAKIESMLRGEDTEEGKGFDWTEVVMTVRREQSVRLRRPSDALSEVPISSVESGKHSSQGQLQVQ